MENKAYAAALDAAAEKFKKILEGQLARIEDMKSQGDFTDYSKLDTIKIGICGGDGIGPIISAEASEVLKFILSDLEASGKVKFINIEGLTFKNVTFQIFHLHECCYFCWETETRTRIAGVSDRFPNLLEDLPLFV